MERGGGALIRIGNLKVLPGQGAREAFLLAQKSLRLKEGQALSYQIARESVDARDKKGIRLVYTLDITLAYGESALLRAFKDKGLTKTPESPRLVIPKAKSKLMVSVVGLGPAGLFAALYLARAGYRPLVLERGLPVEQRGRSVNALMRAGILDPESNFQFGEGGAGAFSDGKLTSGIKDPLAMEVLRTLVDFGADPRILYQQRPHIGTDKLPKIVSAIRKEIETLGGTVLFGARLEGLLTDGGQIRGLMVSHQGTTREFPCDALVLAIGHSARDTQEMLFQQGLALAPKPFSLGVRIEHPQDFINLAQYGSQTDHSLLPAAEYHLAHHTSLGRGAYTFCMCPGGRVIPAASEEGMVCVNGMSNSRRDGENANAALLVEVRPEDYAHYGHPLGGFAFQREYERRAFILGGGGYKAPAQLAGDFLQKRPSAALGRVSPTYKPGIQLGSLDEALPDFVAAGLREALPAFGRRLPGFDLEDAVLTGIEARSSCPVQAHRDAHCQSNIKGLFPAGEGAGRAGGILSAAVDGLRAAMGLRELDETGKGNG